MPNNLQVYSFYIYILLYTALWVIYLRIVSLVSLTSFYIYPFFNKKNICERK